METNKQHIIDELKRKQTALPDDAFFDRLKTDLLQQIEPATTTPVVPLYRNRWLLTAAAASVVVLITVSVFFRGEHSVPADNKRVSWEDVSRDELLAYIDANISEFDTELLAQHLDSIPHWQSASNATSFVGKTGKRLHTPPSKPNLFQDIEKEDIIRYLEEEDIDIDDELF